MKVLIIGSTSVIGKALGRHLSEQGIEVKFAGRKQADIAFDLTAWQEKATTSQVFDVVVHVAADFGGYTARDFIRAELVNGVGTLAACALAYEVRAAHFIFLSSISASYQAGDPYYGIYALTKRHGEEVAHYFCSERDIALTILRPSQVYDDVGRCRRHQEFFYLVADQAQAGQDIQLFGSYDASRNYLHLSDLLETITRVVRGRHEGAFTCAHPTDVSISELANTALKVFSAGGKVKFVANKPDMEDLPQKGDAALYELIDYWPSVDIEQGYQRIKRYREANA